MIHTQLLFQLQGYLASLRETLSTESVETQLQALLIMRLYLDAERERLNQSSQLTRA